MPTSVDVGVGSSKSTLVSLVDLRLLSWVKSVCYSVTIEIFGTVGITTRTSLPKIIWEQGRVAANVSHGAGGGQHA